MWCLEGFDASGDLPVFDPADGSRVAEPERFGGKRWWVLCPPGATLSAEPEDASFVREVFPALAEGWAEWSAYEVDVSSLTHLVVGTDGRRRRVGIQRSVPQAPPRLVGGRLYSGLREDLPLYVGPPPRVFIPLSVGSGRHEVLALWHLAVARDEGETWSVPLRDLADGVRWGDGGMSVPLEDVRLLGSRPFGQYVVSCATSGSETAFRFRIVPVLELQGLDDLLVPDPSGNTQSATVTIGLEAGSTLTLLQEGAEMPLVKRRASAGLARYAVRVPPAQSDLALRLASGAEVNAPVVPVRLVVPWLRWRLLRVGGDYPDLWSVRCLATSVDMLDQSRDPVLIIDLPRIHPATPVRLVLIDVAGERLQEAIVDSCSRSGRYRLFDLRTLRDALRELVGPRSLVEVHLEVEREGGVIGLPLLRITRHPVLGGLALTRERVGEERRLRAVWQPAERLARRELRLWSRTRPWEDPVVLGIPDDAAGEACWQVPSAAVPPGLYSAELVVAEQWADAGPLTPPAPDAPHAYTLWHGRHRQRHAALQARIAADRASFEEAAECAFLHLAYGDLEPIPVLVDWCYRHAAEATAEVLLALVDGLGDVADCTALAMRMYTAEGIRAVVEASGLGEWDRDRLTAFLRVRPSLRAVPPEVLVTLLDIEDGDLRTTAARMLIRLRRAAGSRAVCEWFAAGSISLDDALDLLEASPSFSMEDLIAQPASPAARQLVTALGRARPQSIRLLRRGYWVRCRVGWGRIEQITDAQGQPLEEVHVDDLARGGTLRVCVRPEHDQLRAIVELAARQVTVEAPQSSLFGCPRCDRFVSASYDLVHGPHNRAAHEGTAFGYRSVLVGRPMRQRTDLRYSIDTPGDIWS